MNLSLFNKFKKSTGFAIIIGVLIIFFLLLHFSGVVRPLDRVILDSKFQNFQRDYENNDIVFVDIDQNSLEVFSNQLRIYWPWPREAHQFLQDYLIKDGAKSVVFDIFFENPDFDRLDTDSEVSDNRFARSLANSNSTILASQTSASQGRETSDDISNFVYEIESDLDIDGYFLGIIPYEPFREHAAGLGNAMIPTSEDAVVRRVPLFTKLKDGKWLPSLSMAAWLQNFPSDPEISIKDGFIHIDEYKIPIDQNGNYLINWYKMGGSQQGTFTYYSYAAIMRTASAALQNNPDGMLVEPGTFKDKTVIIGASAAGLSDIKATPLSIYQPFPGMEIHATALANLQDGIFISELPSSIHFLIILGLIFGIAGTIMYMDYKRGLIFASLLFISVILISVIIFAQTRFWLPTGFFGVTMIVTLAVSSIYRYMTEERSKRIIKSAFNQYVQKELVDEILDQPELLKLGGEKREMTVMFSDLAGFTAISEKLEPEQLVDFLNEYLSAMTDIIFVHKGTLDKYIGDAIMAFWGAPLKQENHAELACRSVLRMIRVTDHLRELWLSQGKPFVHVRYGINTGPMVVGNMGSLERFNYTVMGDSVNLGARLEPANNMFSTTAMISEFTYEKVKDKFFCRKLDLMAVKGKNEPVTVYELIAENSEHEIIESYKPIVEDFQIGLKHYYNQEWDKAEDYFRKHPDDGPSTTYLDRIAKFKITPPDADWDGVYRMTTK